MNVYSKLLICGILFCASALANAQNVHGVLRVVKGDVQIKSAKTGQTGKARIGGQVFPQDVVITGKDARAKIVMVDNNEINVSPESQVEIQHYEYDPAAGKKDVLLNVIYGKVRSKVEQKYDGKTSKFQVKTPSAVAGVRGTDFITSFNRIDQTTQVITFHGKVEFGIPGANGAISNAVAVTPGKTASSSGGAPPSAPIDMPKSDLAKIDNDSKADGPAVKTDRQPANEGAKEKNETKKDQTGNEGNGKGNGNGNLRNDDKGRGPASVEGGTGGSMINTSTDLPTGDNRPTMGGGVVMPPPPPPPPPVLPNPNNTNVQNMIQNGKTKLTVTIKTSP